MTRSFVYEVARVRMRESSLFTGYDEKCLLACKNYEECINFLKSKGWGYIEKRHNDYELILEEELEKAWKFILDLAGDKNLFAVFLCQNDYENLKISIKSIITNSKEEVIYAPEGLLLPDDIYDSIKNNKIQDLPQYMQKSAKTAIEVLLHTGDGQLCDVILDKDLLRMIKFFADKSSCDLVKYYANTTIACANIKIVTRSMKTKKSDKFLQKACFFECEGLNINELIKSSLKGMDELCRFLTFTQYSTCVSVLKDSLVSFEKWRDDTILEKAKEAKVNSFSMSPLVSYLIAKKNEIQIVRMVIFSKINKIPESVIEKRMRKLYA
ncbi:MAG: V-type ATPase subunit [Oscillospiraceae bacterium]|jgi:V/A-type H+-transporting ATPase subunit C|nr:V-type ATPase subunit [Oscillospiraceae bacterium]